MVERLAEEADLDQENCLPLDSGLSRMPGYTVFFSLELFIYNKIVGLWSSPVEVHVLF